MRAARHAPGGQEHEERTNVTALGNGERTGMTGQRHEGGSRLTAMEMVKGRELRWRGKTDYTDSLKDAGSAGLTTNEHRALKRPWARLSSSFTPGFYSTSWNYKSQNAKLIPGLECKLP